jgi:oligosaccharide repeat unit polymerase
MRKRGFDVSAYITLLYLITSVFSLLMFSMNIVERRYSNPSFFATLVYCILLSLTILPIYQCNIKRVQLRLTRKTERIIKILNWLFFLNFLLFLYLRFNDIYNIIKAGDFVAIRQLIQSEEVGHVHGFNGLLIIVTNIMSSISFVMILVFFISLSFYKNTWKFNLMILLGSLPEVLSGILTVNRSNIFYYIIIFGLCCVIFWERIPYKAKLRFGLPILSLFGAMMLYFSAVTVSRFDDTNTSYGNVSNSLISYAGMPYSNFCYFFDNYKNPDWMSTRYLLPVTNFLFNGYRAGTEREEEQTDRTGFNCVGFMTFLGSFMMDSNQLMPFVYVIIYLLLFRLCRSHIRGRTISFLWLLVLFLLLIVPSVGCLSYFYTNPFRSMALYLLLLFIPKQ